MSILIVQQKLAEAGLDPGPLDGRWGARTAAALDEALAGRRQSAAGRPGSLAWGAKVSPEFRDRVFVLCARMRMNPDFLMACMAWESGETFSPSIVNRAGSGATGLIQFMPTTARNLGTSTAQLAQMTAVQQLDFVESYFRPYRGRLMSLSDHYMAILWPNAIGKPESHILWSRDRNPVTFRQNSGIDVNRDGVITKAEAAGKVNAKLIRGMSPALVWRGR